MPSRRKQSQVNKQKPWSISYGPHVLALIDFLGQSSRLTDWDYPPDNDEQKLANRNAIEETVGFILRARERFDYVFRQVCDRARPTQQSLKKKYAKAAHVQERFETTRLETSHFSDTLVFYAKLINNHSVLQVEQLCGMIFGAGALLLEFMALGKPFRGAIEIGNLANFPTGEPYGPCLATAHHLESKVASYPRVVVGPEAVKYLRSWIEEPDPDPPGPQYAEIAKSFFRAVSQDQDGHYFVDYLGERFNELSPDLENRMQIQRQAMKFIGRELDRFKRADNTCLIQRYEVLRKYFSARELKC